MDLYLNPKTAFAASFMGHCNLLSHETFQQVIALENVKEGFYAIRPENIGINLKENIEYTQNNYYFKGVVKRIIPQGNTIRYTVVVNGNLIDVDTLFEVNNQLTRNDDVYLSIDKELIIYFNSSKKIS
ncbi:TOBE domain-containing protein [Marinisporobacter balticus]|nr:TOBE domain-containing protein [Marinisporobacter balticus]